MLFTSNDTLKKLEKILPKSINGLIIPIDIIKYIASYIQLNDKNIHQVIKKYYNENHRQQVINNYGRINDWDVSQVTNMKKLFAGINHFNEDISNWNVSNVTTMQSMFFSTDFDQPLNNLIVSNVTNMKGMFYAASL